jgi:hypothetical protein
MGGQTGTLCSGTVPEGEKHQGPLAAGCDSPKHMLSATMAYFTIERIAIDASTKTEHTLLPRPSHLVTFYLHEPA